MVKPRTVRAHKVTHPVLGVASWPEIRDAANELRKDGNKYCSWCFGPVGGRFRTGCGGTCREMINGVVYWSVQRRRVFKRDKFCWCGAYGEEVDHIIPVSLGGTGDLWNLRLLCIPHHKMETDRLKREGAAFVAAWRGND